ncbi:MAG: hypothetical protein CM1200mP2_03090 [Planctomycetaceae bacterium]|nr:MAG: hypothetical protein CM1200mP2_03090 [Planctomycetaceae bacterium]
MTGVEARNNNGDGISWQICHDVVVENCHSHDNADLGLHPGSGSQRPLIRKKQGRTQQYRRLLLLGDQVRVGREQPDHRQSQLRGLKRSL